MDFKIPVLVLVSIATFLLAAKSHGRQIRLERERAGYHQVVFGGSNPAFVEQLWKRDRLHYWPTFALAALVVLFLRARGVGPEGFGYTAWALWFVPFISAFTVAGLWSLFELWSTRAANPDFTAAALRVSALLWPAVLAGAALALKLFATAIPLGARGSELGAN